ncbi:hypothetical protein H310_01918 [Aphanomyces invadans]|uniref:Kaptin n=1 Tax=Aphanomyces invadans TaxID=157072 RepID=A0A024UP76_9STRA|nr:hypothetical protein H310_01918 [Aphanomyces invadans]ETW07393.1 hypothetical protein H310_01918 [Aphanomyces invadans]|eukprot:XP_008863486.1 hypothetical protein H310_01918 [Aphanomyces invadans]
MGYGQTWLFRYPAPLHDAEVGMEREYSRQPSYYDMEDVDEEEATNVTAMISRDKDVAAFAMTPIAPDRSDALLLALLYRRDDNQFHFSAVGLRKDSTPTPLDRAMANANMPHEASLLSCDVLQLPSSRSVLLLLYQEPRDGRCWLTLQPVGSGTHGEQVSGRRQRFEQSSVPLKPVVVTARHNEKIFYGVLLFRFESVIACGYVHDSSTSPDNQTPLEAEQLPPDDFARFFPHLVECPLGVTAYHTTTTTSDKESPTRVLALGCANGVIKVMGGKAALDGFESVACTKQFELDGPISSLHVFNVHAHVDTRDRCAMHCDVLVSSSIGFAAVYHDPFDSACRPHVLPESDYYDSILCCLSADIDMDGIPELLLGTFSNALIAYESKPDSRNATNPSPGTRYPLHDGGGADASAASWRVVAKDKWDFFFFGPVYAIVCQDMNGDGVDELIIASTDGIHVLEPDCDQVLEKLHAVLQALQQPGP